MRLKGRIWIAIWLVFTLFVLAWVVTRDTSGIMTASKLRSLRREAESRAVLITRAESMGLRLPADSEIVILQATMRERR